MGKPPMQLLYLFEVVSCGLHPIVYCVDVFGLFGVGKTYGSVLEVPFEAYEDRH